MADHLNVIERALIDNLRTGTYKTSSGSAAAWTASEVTVFGQFPMPEDVRYPSIIVQMVANGMEEQMMGQNITFGSEDKHGEIYGVGFNIYVTVDTDSVITVDGVGYKERRLLNYLMLNVANVLMDCDLEGSPSTTEVIQRHHSGFMDIGYNPVTETWSSMISMFITFKNDR
jgi:hypothetical protein